MLRIRGPADLLQAVPYLLGFHPESSVVILGLNRSRLVVTVRLDLADTGTGDTIGAALRAMQRGGAAELVAVIYDHPPGVVRRPLPWEALVAGFRTEAAQAGCDLIDALLVAHDSWWSYSCRDTTCCPSRGRRLAHGTSEFSAAATYAGMVALPSRAALAALLDPLPDEERDRLHPRLAEHENAEMQAILAGRGAQHERSVKRALFSAARAVAVSGEQACGVTIGDDHVARFGVALSSQPLRDSLWMAADDGRLDGRPLWLDLARRLPSPYDAAPLFLYGWCSWRAGNGALAGLAAEQAVRSDPGYSAADLLLAALARGLDPGRLPKLRLRRPA